MSARAVAPARAAAEPVPAAAERAAVVAVAAAAVDVKRSTNRMETTMGNNRWDVGLRAREWGWLALALIGTLFLATAARAAAADQKTFATPDEAANALVQAVKAHDRAATLAVLGKASSWISSGDTVADRAAGDRFVAAYESKHAIQQNGDTATLVIGNDDYPFAFPIAKSGDRWRFDTEAGKHEMLVRRIGENEIDAINVLEAIVDAQMEYASKDRNGDGVLDYAQKFASSPGKRDGLYWKTSAGEPPSPLGALVVQASGEGYKKKEGGPTPYHGYYYRMLKGQGANASGGAFDYVVRGHGIAGFAVIAYPAKYGSSGIMTFMVNQDGKIYQADLGPSTAERASSMRRFDPGKEWTPAAAR
jgi:DUF2950 family protein